MKNILAVSDHPELTHSVANATILDEVATALPDAEIRRLEWIYPDGKFNIAAEQESLLRADMIVWQFPFSWYGLPGLMKQWLDEVFVHGFAHGSTAKLDGKKLLLPFTTGAPQELYTADGFFGHAIEEYLIPFETTARLCNLELLAPIYTCGISYADRDADKIAQQITLAWNTLCPVFLRSDTFSLPSWSSCVVPAAFSKLSCVEVLKFPELGLNVKETNVSS